MMSSICKASTKWKCFGVLVTFTVPVVIIVYLELQRLCDVRKIISPSRYLGSSPKLPVDTRWIPVLQVESHNQGSALSHSHSFPYHRHWKVNCTILFSGDNDVIKETAEVIRRERERANGSLPVPDDVEVQRWTKDCEAFRRDRSYPQHRLSDEEANFSLAYTIITHTTSAQVERLLRAIYQPQNIYCIHPDLKSSLNFHRAIRGLASCFDNVFVASKLEAIQYAGFTRLLADINCMTDLTGPRSAGYEWKYLINLCGQDFPLKTNIEIVRQMKFYNGTNDIVSLVPFLNKLPWTTFQHRVENGEVVITTNRKMSPPHNLSVYNGNAYFAATRQFVEFALNDQRAHDLLEWTKDTYSPDENFWATLQRVPGAPGGFPVSLATPGHKFRFVKWETGPKPACGFGKVVRLVCVFGIDYLQYLLVVPNLFANKFHYSFDPVTLQCLEEQLDLRSTHPEESNNLPNFPVHHMKR